MKLEKMLIWRQHLPVVQLSKLVNSDLFATNLFAVGGTAGSFSGQLVRDLSAGTYGADASGGTGIKSSGSDLNIYKGEIIGTDGGYFEITVQDAYTWNIDHTANGGNAIDGGSGSGILDQLTASGGNGGQFKLETPSAGSYTIGLSGGDVCWEFYWWSHIKQYTSRR